VKQRITSLILKIGVEQWYPKLDAKINPPLNAKSIRIIYTIKARSDSANTITFTIEFNDVVTDNNVDNNVDGRLSSNIQHYRASEVGGVTVDQPTYSNQITLA
jgi:hypothetical protein